MKTIKDYQKEKRKLAKEISDSQETVDFLREKVGNVENIFSYIESEIGMNNNEQNFTLGEKGVLILEHIKKVQREVDIVRHEVFSKDKENERLLTVIQWLINPKRVPKFKLVSDEELDLLNYNKKQS